MAEFLVVEDDAGELLGCAQVHVHRPDNVEILAVSVLPRAQDQGVGRMLMRKALEVAMERKPSFLWLATGKPDYFATFGFRPITKWHLPLPILIYKLRLVFHQRPVRWVPAILGRPVFMRFSGEG